MTDLEKIGQMILVYHSPYSFLEENRIGGVLIMANMLKKPSALAREVQRIQKKMSIGLLVTIDQEGGSVNRLCEMERWRHVRSAREQARMGPDSIFRYTEAIASQLKELGVNINLAPVLDPSHNWKGEKTFMEMKDRAYGRTAEEILEPAMPFIRGFSSRGILCIGKHFPGYDVSTNSDFNLAQSVADSPAVAEYVRAFKGAIGEMAGVLMSSIHYSSVNGRPSVLSPEMVGWARQVCGDKLIVTDDLWGTALRSYVSPGIKITNADYPDQDFSRLVELAFLAGNDVLMITFPQKVKIIQTAVLRLLRENPEARTRLDESVRRILLVKQKLGLIKPGLPEKN